MCVRESLSFLYTMRKGKAEKQKVTKQRWHAGQKLSFWLCVCVVDDYKHTKERKMDFRSQLACCERKRIMMRFNL